MSEWTRDWPTIAGWYWMWSYRYGRVSCGSITERELVMCEAVPCGNGSIMLKANGQFVFASEPEDAQFHPAQPPISPPFYPIQDKFDCELSLHWEEARREDISRRHSRMH